VWPKGRVQTTPREDGTVQLSYDGIGYQDARVRPGGADENPALHLPPLPQVPVRLAGQVDAARHVASVDVWVNGEHHHIGSAGQVSGAQGVVDDFLTSLRTGNWNKLYSVESTYMHNAGRRSDFMTQLANGGAVNTISDARVVGPTAYSTSDAGVSYVRAPIRVTYGDGPAATQVPATLVLAVDAGAWKVLGVE
jgi:hypothetical protein